MSVSQDGRVSYARAQQLGVKYIGRSTQSPLAQAIVNEGFGGEPKVAANQCRGSIVHRLLVLAEDITALAAALAEDSEDGA